jgi:exopolyphosphatase/guanosine-5'-triphosphate,3'-diphosphate pyrophosphatase
MMQNGSLLAALDLGSNSYRLEIARLDHGQIARTEYIKETVRQGNGLDENRNLTPSAMQRGWDCLARFGERLVGFKKSNVRAVATQTLREARNREEFLSKGQTILGFPIEVISGREEARMIYQGVARMLPETHERRLVIDIGGRSTEIILGHHFEPQVMESYRTGSVAWSMKYFADGQFTPEAFYRAQIAAKAVLDEAIDLYPKEEWDHAYGSSGTVGAVADALGASGWSSEVITWEALVWLEKALIRAQSLEKLRLEGIKEDRKAVIGGGIAVLKAVFELLQIETLHCAQGALRHGVLYDLIEREDSNTDTRTLTIQRLQSAFHVDTSQAQRVAKVARHFLAQLCSQKNDGSNQQSMLKTIEWGAHLHEIGMCISHTDYHKHGAYILDQSDAAGFALSELHQLSLLVYGHRGKLKKLDADFEDENFSLILMSLRLAVIICHARREPEYEQIRLVLPKKSNQSVEIVLPPLWSLNFPQSLHLLHQEVNSWLKTGWHISINQLEVKPLDR